VTDPDPEHDADLARLASSGNLEAAIVGGLVLLLLWPITHVLRRRRRRT
jgi:hypothetical protein